MWLQALLTPADLKSIVAEMTPVQIALDPDDPTATLPGAGSPDLD